ncbi:MAG: DUF4142 domain-containing protein [Planctomycetes bacterium]|nr:DUF4142 domain-containing protein [Planctomycetota bacterium]
MKLYLLSLSALLMCACRKDVEAADVGRSYNPPVGENPTDPIPRDPLPTVTPPVEPMRPVEPTRKDPLQNPPVTPPTSSLSDPLADPTLPPRLDEDVGLDSLPLPPDGVPIPEVGATPDLPAPQITPADQKFVQQASYGGLFEVAASQLVLDKSESDPHRRFAQQMVDEHRQLNKDLADLMRIKGGDVPATLDAVHQRMLDDLTKLDASQLDGAYREAQITVHDEAIRLFDGASSAVDDPELLAFAQRVLPKLREHRRELDGLHETP